MPWRPRIRTTTLLIYLCICFLAGLGLSRRLRFEYSWIAICVALAAVIICRRKRVVVLISVVCLGLLAGLWRGAHYMGEVQAYQTLMHRRVTLVARANADAVYGDKSQMEFEASNIVVERPVQTRLAGKIKVSGFGVPMVYKGDTLRVQGSLYQTRGGAQARMSFANVRVVARNDSPIDRTRRQFVAGLQAVLPEPQASFGAGLLIGQRSTLPQDTNDTLSAVGLTHLVAVSGYNLTILIDAVRRFYGKRSKFQSTMLALLLITAFVVMTGLSASIVRAALVSGLSLAAWYYGRTFRPVLLLALVAALTAWWNPFYLWSDVGWYLSFLAFFGVLVLAPLVTRRISRAGKVNDVVAVAIECLAAQVMTLPIIMYIFGRISVTGLVANILVVPLVPLAMLGLLVAGIVGMFGPIMGAWVVWPVRMLLTYMLDVATFMSRLPMATVERSIMLWQMLVLYGGTAGLTLVLWHKTPRKSDIITDEAGEM